MRYTLPIRPMILLNAVVTVVVAVLAFNLRPFPASSQELPVQLRRDVVTEKYYQFYTTTLKAYAESSIARHDFNGKAFCYYEDAGNKLNESVITHYLYIYCQEYYVKDAKLHIGSGIAGPVAVRIKALSDQFSIIDHSWPGSDGIDRNQIFSEPFIAKLKSLDTMSQYPVWPKFEPLAKKYFNVATTVYE